MKINSRFFTPALYALVIVGYPFIATMSTFIGQHSQIVSIAYRALVLGISVILIVSGFFGNRQEFTRNVFRKYVYIFWFLYSLRIILDTVANPVVLHFGFKEYYLSALGACFLPMIALMRPQRDQDLQMAYKVILFMGLIVAIFIWIIQFQSGLLNTGYSSWGGRLALETLNPILVGHLSVSIIIISLYSLLIKSKLLPKPVFLAASLVGIVTAVSSASKGPLLALLMVFFLFFISRAKKGFKIQHVMLLIVSGIIMIQAARYAENQFGFSSVSRLQVSDDNRSTLGRLSVIKGAWNQFIDNPFFGSSLEERVTLFYPHNVLLESFMATGVLGGSVFFLLIVFSVTKAYRIIKYDRSSALLAMLYIQGLIGALLSGSLWGSGHMWVFMGSVFAVKIKRAVRVGQSSQ